eukprot:TRINITY_DN8922_c0_g1_i1.p1 TRINITY_DN8922_c0_g1~~TRINITY_DN8922_c0_g1_i1.p1  ORF type:complete len:377 (+),score=44.18 TRINITY_DN8922_c0_g1_i1:73-1203(+)
MASQPTLSSESSETFQQLCSETIQECFQLSERLKKAEKRLQDDFKEFDDILTRRESAKTQYKNLIHILNELATEHKEPSWKNQLEKYRLELSRLKSSLDSLKSVAPSWNESLFLRLFMGSVNVKFWKQGEKLQFKKEYEKFKFRTTFIFLLFPIIILFVTAHPLLFTLHQVWLLYYYISLSIRSNILQANGSQIFSWWIFHHYITMVICVVLLAAPFDHALHQEIIFSAEVFALWQGLVMIITNEYTRKRLYVRQSLGKASIMDVESPETIVEKPTNLKILLPLLFVTYTAQIYLGSHAVLRFFTSMIFLSFDQLSWQLLVIGLLWFVLGVGNVITTVLVIWNKKQTKDLYLRQRAQTPRVMAATPIAPSPSLHLN